MYLDKKVSGVEAVQTLSRLNRVTSGRDTTFVIDFVNEPEEILTAFRTYHDGAEISEAQDPNVVYELKDHLDASGLYRREEVDAVSTILLPEMHATKASARLTNAVGPAVERFNARMTELNETIGRWEDVSDRRLASGDERGATGSSRRATSRRSASSSDATRRSASNSRRRTARSR